MVKGRVCDSAKSVTTSPLRCSTWHCRFSHSHRAFISPLGKTRLVLWPSHHNPSWGLKSIQQDPETACKWICSSFLVEERHICANVSLVYPTIIGPAAVHVGWAILAYPCRKKPLAGHRQTTSLVETSRAAQTRLSSQSPEKDVETINACYSKPQNFSY